LEKEGVKHLYVALALIWQEYLFEDLLVLFDWLVTFYMNMIDYVSNTRSVVFLKMFTLNSFIYEGLLALLIEAVCFWGSNKVVNSFIFFLFCSSSSLFFSFWLITLKLSRVSSQIYNFTFIIPN